MKQRTTKPKNNKYYMRIVSGGLNGAVQGYPVDKTANVLSNCVGYANGRFNESINDPDLKGLTKKFKYQLVCNAENFIERAKQQGLKVVNHPVRWGIMVWQKGNTLDDYDGAGHVAFVENVISGNEVKCSESAYGSYAFKIITRTNDNGRWGMSAGYTFRGCIVNPSVKETPTPQPQKAIKYKVVCKDGMNVRAKANTSAKIVGTLNYGAEFISTKQSGDWAYCDSKKGWVCIKQGKTVFLKKV